MERWHEYVEDFMEELRYSKNGIRITEKKSRASRENILKYLEKRNAYANGIIPLPDDGIERTKDGRRMTDKWRAGISRNIEKIRGSKRVDTPYRQRTKGVEFPIWFLEILDSFVGGKMRRVKYIEKIISEKIAEETNQGLSQFEIISRLPPSTYNHGGTPSRIVELHSDFLEKVNAHVGNKSLRVRSMIGILTTHIKDTTP